MIPVCKPTFIKNEKNFVYECLEDCWISSKGKFIEAFEEQFSKFCECKYGVTCSNGTTALHLALLSLGIVEGDEVIVPNFSMIAVPNSVIYSKATPVFVDAEIDTWNINPEQIEKKITDKTKAIIVVHTYGLPVNMDRINRIAKKHNLKVIKDCAEAHGAIFKGKKVGSLGDVATFSFYGNKIITTGEGGMVVTNNEEIANKCKLLRNHAFEENRFIHNEIGFNYRMTNIQAAIGVAQTAQANKLIEMRIENAKMYDKLLKGIKGITLPPRCSNSKNVYWMYGILVDKEKYGMDKDTLMEALKKTGIDTRSFFYPCNKQPAYLKLKNIDCEGEYKVSNTLYEKGFYLPSASCLTDKEIKRICETIRGFQNEN